MTTTAKRYGAYHRVSDANGRDLDAETTITDKVAFEQIDGWAKMRGVKVVERYLDWDSTGSKMSRPDLDRMLADLEAGHIDGIVVAQVDRLSRADVGDALAIVKQIVGDDEAHPRPLVLLDLGIDPASEFGELGLTILLGLARMQWRRYQRQWRTATQRAVARGAWIGPVPLGYVRTTFTVNDKAVNGPLAPCEVAGPHITNAYVIAASDGLHAACRYLGEHFPSMRWRTSDARRVLSCPAYLGRIEYGKLVNPSAHPALTDPDTYQAAQTEPRDRRTSGDYVLSRIATCDECGEGLTGQLQTVRKGAASYRRYRCSNKACGGGSSIRAETLEAYVREGLGRLLASRKLRTATGGADLGEARADLVSAERARDLFADDIEWQDSLGREASMVKSAAHRRAVEAALIVYSDAAAAAARHETLPTADQMHDDTQLLRAISAGRVFITVARGRGAVEDRVHIGFDDLDEQPGVIAA